MEWLKELLKNAGFEEGKIDEFVTEFNKEVPKHLIPKEKYNELSESKKKLETDLSDRDKQLETLKEAAGSSKKLQDQIEQLQADNKAAKEKFESEAEELQMKTALKLKLAGKVHEKAIDEVVKHFDHTKITLDENGSIKDGFEDQEKSLRESMDFYFVSEKNDKPSFKGFKPFDGQSGGGEDKGNNLGKQLAAQNKQAGADMQKAQANYFGGGNE